jgi:predicted homoserine dehydrogenase-like protein
VAIPILVIYRQIPLDPVKLENFCLGDAVVERNGSNFIMNLHKLALSRIENGQPQVRVGLIGAGKFGAMFLNQVPTSPLQVTAIADLAPDRARATCRHVGWDEGRIDRVAFHEDAVELAARDDVDVILEVTGSPAAGIRHARAAFANGKHIVMVNVEADALAGPLLAREAQKAGVIYSMAYGDQPAMICELVDWARAAGFEVVAAGKGTKYLPEYHASTPDTVWQYYGLSAEEAGKAGMNSQMFNSFLDGTKSAIEMTAVANATGLLPTSDGLGFPDVATSELQDRLIPAAHGGLLECDGQVEVVSSMHRDGVEIADDLRWGVYAVFKAPNEYARDCFRQYGVRTDPSGWYAAIYRPFHLIGLELGISVLSVALRGEPTGQTSWFNADVVSIAKRDLKAGEMLDGEGGYTVWGKAVPAAKSLKLGALPIGLAHGIALRQPVRRGQTICWNHVNAPADSEVVRTRREMERTCSPIAGKPGSGRDKY